MFCFRATPKALKYYADILLDRNTSDGSARPTPPMRYVMLHARPAWVMLPESVQVPEGVKEPFNLEYYHNGDLAVFVSQFPFRISVGSAMQVGISPRATGGRKVRMNVPEWTDPIEWLLDEPRFAAGGVALEVEEIRKEGSPWPRNSIGSLAEGLPVLDGWDSRGGHGVGELSLRFRIPGNIQPGSILAMLIQTGAVADGFQMRWLDSSTGEPVFEMNGVPLIESEWLLIKLPASSLQGGQELDWIISDTKPDFGAWIGFSEPMLIAPISPN